MGEDEWRRNEKEVSSGDRVGGKQGGEARLGFSHAH